MIIWKGKGYLIAIIVFLSSFIMEMISEGITGNDQLYQESPHFVLLAFLIAGLITKIVYQKVVYTEKENYRDFMYNKEELNYLFFVPFKYWPPILYAIGIIIWILRLVRNLY